MIDESRSIMTRAEAKALGLTTYHSDNPCSRGHRERYVGSDKCKECKDISRKKAKEYGPRCSVDGCKKPRDTQGFCPAHYQRWKNHGDPLAGKPFAGDGLKWLADHVDYDGEGCLIWPFGTAMKGKNGSKGYGLTYIDGEGIGAHVVMCRMAHGEKPDDDHIATHSCGKGHDACVHPGHLRWGTHAQNAADRYAHGTAAMCKLTEAEVRQIRTMKGIVSQESLAKMYGVGESTISAVHSGKSWAHLK